SGNYYYLGTYGATLYRAGKPEKAIEQLQKATKQRAVVFSRSDERAYLDAFDLLFKAMAQHALGQKEQARKTLVSAIQSVERVQPAQLSEASSTSLDRVWQRLEFEVLLREAKNLIRP